ncbi:hypothetical protein Clacol_001915 [Clathrus columnatus]|uniref:Carboxypeptidase n=1 Tax=Clathrus columnatus TaxID=1419009 RepID=A0AAV5A0E3_9AGAM|nr:hypothetical protein Clacol_001915 [Clathrus columnatus]
MQLFRVGVGFSYADYGETVETTEDAAKNIHAFMFVVLHDIPPLYLQLFSSAIFFDTFKQFQGRKFHLSGESYGGKYLPVFAAEIYDQERKRTEGVPINLRANSYYRKRKHRYIKVPRCQRLLVENCYDIFDDMACNAAVNFCDSEISAPLWATGLNVYDISKKCLGDSLCYLEEDQIASYLDLPHVRDTLGVPSNIGNFSGCSDIVGNNFNKHMDKWRLPAQLYVAELLERGIPILIYAGTYDWQCNWVSNYEWSHELEWSGATNFRAETMRDWTLPNTQTIAGQTRSAGNLTMTTIYGAGHMVPHDKPAESLFMLQQWLAGKQL